MGSDCSLQGCISSKDLLGSYIRIWDPYPCLLVRVVLDSHFSGWLDSDSCTIQVIQLWLNSTLYFSWLTQLRLNSNSKSVNWLNSDSTHLSQSLVKFDSRLIIFYLIWPKFVDRGGGVRSNAAVRWLFPCNDINKCKILMFPPQKNQWLKLDSSSIQLTPLWHKWRSAWFDSDSTHINILDFQSRLNSDSTHSSQSRVKFDSRLMSATTPVRCVSPSPLLHWRV